METKNWPALPRANVSVLGAMQTAERNVTNGLSGPARATSAKLYCGDVAVCCEVALYSTMYVPVSAPMGIPTPQVDHISKELACIPKPSASGTFDPHLKHWWNVFPHAAPPTTLPLSNRQKCCIRMSVQDSEVLKSFFTPQVWNTFEDFYIFT